MSYTVATVAPMPTLPLLKIDRTPESRLRYLWAKAVVGVDLSQHCARSLVGPYIDGLGARLTHGTAELPLEVDGQPVLAWYVCGVDARFEWERNVHLLAVPEAGEEAVVEHCGTTATIVGGRRVAIDPAWIDGEHPKARFKSYATCRNWQAAWMIERGAILTPDLTKVSS